jgi:lipoprotein-anchoring transpeptidase ErfK/SrfK
MGTKKSKRIFRLITLAMLMAAIVIVILFLSADKPPLDTIKLARENLGKARGAGAEEYAGLLMKEAEETWKQAMEEWEAQNAKWFISRNYTGLDQLSQLAAQKAEKAYEQAVLIKESFHNDLPEILLYVQGKLESYEKKYGSLPSEQQSRSEYSKAKILFLESRQAYDRGNYNQVGPQLDKSRDLIEKAISKSNSSLTNYFKAYPTWKKWTNETIEWSRSKSSSAIVVDKFARKCYIYRNGSLKSTFNIELGPNWIGTKLHQGDKATPEGKYHITKKKKNRATRYHKALLINYPNDQDRVRYEKAVSSGRISKNTGIGNLIEIHGEGGRGMDWTDGCIALENADMDAVYRLVSVGTPVTIVGSLRSLEEIND